MTGKIYVIIPAYNEAQTIVKVVSEVEKYADKIVLVDDGSKDGTSKLIKSEKTVIIQHPINLGQGSALETGFGFARQRGANIVVTFDADGQFVASEIPRLIKPISDGKADVVLGSRFLGKTINIPFSKMLLLKFGVLFTNLFSKTKLSDTHNGFRALNKKALLSIKLSQNGFAHASEFIDQIQTNELKFVEVPVTVKYSRHSINKGQKSASALKILFDLVSNILK